MPTELKILKAFNGDSILITSKDENGDDFILLIDGGPSSTFEYTLRKELSTISKIDLLVLTHIDSDHIGGLIKFIKSSLFEKIEIKKYWVNAKNLFRVSTGETISYTQGLTFEELLISLKVAREKIETAITTSNKSIIIRPGINATILSPTPAILDKLYNSWPVLSAATAAASKETSISSTNKFPDASVTLEYLAKEAFNPQKSIEKDIFNSSSIAFLLEVPDCKLLLLSDSRPEIIIESLKILGYSSTNKLQVDVVKVSHHGSKNNISNELLSYIDCHNYIISTNGGSVRHKHPDRETIARIVYHENRDFHTKCNIFFNYSTEEIVTRKGTFMIDNDLKGGNFQILQKSIFTF